ncbi:porin family protein [Tenacibaculum sp. TC6]|uniref:porin family protein n=1 Tax=Tenacibaculum sp. TC6 TaxID=3423223 RepID=UPI003D35B8F4
MKLINQLFLVFGLLLSSTMYSQKKIIIGVHGGVNYSSLRFENDEVSEHDSEFDYLYGLNTNIYLNDKFSLQTEINYERKRVSVFSPEFIFNNQTYKSFRVYDLYEFVTIPLTVQYDFSKKSPFYVKGGIFVSFFLKARERTNNREWSNDLSQYFSVLDSGVSLGVGKMFYLSEYASFFLEIRNHLGIKNIESEAHFDYTKTNSLGFLMGCKFKI